MQVGWQMGAGMEKGLLNSVASMARRMPEIMAQITPRVQMPRIEGQGGREAGRQGAGIMVLNEAKLARLLRDAILQSGVIA